MQSWIVKERAQQSWVQWVWSYLVFTGRNSADRNIGMGFKTFVPSVASFFAMRGAMGHFYTIRILAQSLTVLDKFIKFNSRSHSLVGISITVWCACIGPTMALLR